MRMRKTFPIVTHHEPPKPHGFIFASVHHGFPMMFVSYRFPCDASYHLSGNISYHLVGDISYHFRTANLQGLQQLAPLSAHSPQPVRCHAAPPC